MVAISHRMKILKQLHNRLCLVSDAMCCLGLLGIFLMIINNEVNFAVGHNQGTVLNWFIKLSISISTVFLIGLIIYYHKLDLNLYSIKNSVDDWHIGLTEKKLFLIILEILICIIHPIPLHFPSSWSLNATTTTTTTTTTTPASLPLSYISLDVALGLPMFLRLYLVCRFIVWHSPLIHNASSQSLSFLNQVSMDVFFLIKTLLEQSPIRCLVIFCTLIFLIGSWSLRACNYLPTDNHVSILDSMWLFIVTFTTVGYGDITPSTYCGRSVASIIAFTGLLSSALLISVLTQKLVLTRWEKYMYNFVLNIDLSKERKHQAANIVKFAVKAWYLKQKDKSKSMQYMKAQWKLFRSIRVIQEVKLEQRNLMNSCIGFIDLYTLQGDGNDKTEKVIQQISTVKGTIDQIEEKFIDMKQTMMNMQFKLNILLSRIQIQQKEIIL